jgi:hypothetical protein
VLEVIYRGLAGESPQLSLGLGSLLLPPTNLADVGVQHVLGDARQLSLSFPDFLVQVCNRPPQVSLNVLGLVGLLLVLLAERHPQPVKVL